MKLTLITLNFNGAENTIKLLNSLQNQTDSDFSVIVADNGSSDVRELRDYSAGKNINLIENGANLGYAGGNNPAIISAFGSGRADWVLILNNDTLVDKDFIAKLKKELVGKNGLAGLPITELDGQGHAGRAGLIEWLKPELHHINDPQFIDDPDSYIIGGALLISRSAFETLGPIDENYFLYFEDADYSFQARKAGIPINYLPAPSVQHHGSASTKKLGSSLLLRYHYRNALYFNLKNAPLFYEVLAIFWSVFVFVKQIFKLLDKNHPIESRAIMMGIADFYFGKMGYISSKIKVGIECEQIEGEIWGVGRIITKLLENIASRPQLERDFEFYLYFKSEIPKLPFLDKPIFHKKIIDQPFRHKSFVVYYYILLPIQLWFERLDVMYFPNYMLPIIFFGNSIVMLTEDIYHEMRSKQQYLRHRLAYRVFATWATWRADKIMAISETSKKEMVRLFDIKPENIVVNQLAIDAHKSSDENKHGEYFLFVGQAFPRRHLVESLLAFERIAPDFPNLKFIAVGPDRYCPTRTKQLRNNINSRLEGERVILYERVSQKELSELYTHALAVVYVSSREAFGLPPMEGLAHGSVPIIADNALGRELFGENAIFVSQANSIDFIANALREAMTNSALREKIKEHAPEIVSRYTWRAHTDRFIAMIKSMTIHG